MQSLYNLYAFNKYILTYKDLQSTIYSFNNYGANKMPKGTRYTDAQIKTMLDTTNGLTLKEASQKLNIGVSTLCNWRAKKKATKSIKLKIEPKATNIIKLIKQVKADINLIEKGLKKCK